MAARTKKSNTVEPSPADLTPVELDPPDPALARWQELVAVDGNICHDGDASRIIPSPRPAWSDPDEDIVTGKPVQAVYMSAPAVVALSCERGMEFDGGDVLKTSRLVVRAFAGHMLGQDLSGLELKLVRPAKGKNCDDDTPWMHTSWSVSASEAHALIDAVAAALALIEGEK